jgi:diaminopimelate decarboxylase
MEKLKYERPVINKVNLGMPSKFGSKPKILPVTQIEGIELKDLVNEYGSPVFIVSENVIRNTFREAKRAFTTRYPKVQFAWSYKTNYLDTVCKIFHKEGSWAEVVSGFEYKKALRNGVDGKNILFNGPGKSEEDLTMAIKNKSLIHIDHFDELYTLIELAEKLNEKPKVAIRINMDTGIYPQWDRFGFNLENGEAWNAINRIVISEKMELLGLHTHLGTYISSAAPYGMAATKLVTLLLKVKEKFNLNLKYIDLGGGFASKNTLRGAYMPGVDTCPSFDDYAEAITNAIIYSDLRKEELPTLFLETGRALIDDAAWLVGTVIANKRLADGRRSTIIDIGINSLFTSFWYEHKINPGQAFSSQTEDTVIYGPLCMNIDVIRQSIHFPVLKKGDLVVLNQVGAYNMTQWLQFITFRPGIILIDTNGKTHIIRSPENLEYVTELEKIPEHLK